MDKVCVYAISKDEEQFVDRFMDSLEKADSVVVLDTGSLDGTVDRLRRRGAIVDIQEVKPWRFDTARNAAMAMCPRDAVLLSLDMDETIAEPDWRDRILDNWGEANRGRYTYVWDHRPDGTPGKTFSYEKLHTLDFEWFLPCHELLKPRNAQVEERWAEIPITVHHYPDPAKSRGSYLGLLALGVEENPDNDRLAHYYGRELFYHGRWEEAVAQLERHIQMAQATWADERCASMMYAATCFIHLGREADAESWYLRACGEAPWLREPWLEAAKFYLARNRFPMAYALAKRALQIEHRTNSYITNPGSWAEIPHDVIGTAAYYLGLKTESLAAARKAAGLAPWDPRLKDNVEIIERMTPELTGKTRMPKVMLREPWTEDPRFGLVISTFGAEAYVHLALAIRARHYADVPTLVVDDGSEQADELAALCKRYEIDFQTNEVNMNHTRGDLSALCKGLIWASERGLDVLVKMSRRFIPRQDWRPGLRTLITETQHATYAGVFDSTYGFRSECIAYHVARWIAKVKQLEQLAVDSDWLWVEDVLHRVAVEILPWGTGEQDGFALWDFPGLGKWVKSDTHLWHDTANPGDYAALSRQYNLSYTDADFRI